MGPRRVTAVGALVVAAFALAAACDESFPAPLSAATGDAGPSSGPLEGAPPAMIPAAKRVNASSGSVAFDPVRGGVWTANGDVGTVSYVDPAARAVVAEVTVGQDVRAVALSPDGTWLAAVDREGATVALMAAGTRQVMRTLAIGGRPRAAVWDPADPRWLYVTEEEGGSVVVVDRTLGAVVETVPVGPIPAGLVASGTKRELYVSHRIEPEVSVVDLGNRALAAQVPLADEPYTTVTVPNGKPMGFESFALTPDGRTLWTPHELLAPTHPFVFNETLFPAISVVDTAARAEVVSDPNSPNIAGRKNLFDAIKLAGDNGQPAVFSQPCATAFHPNGLIAWALMCGSEDLLTFNVDEGIATDAVRALPCDHPSGMALDDTGQRVFVLCDQSKQLLTLDTRGGSLVAHTTLYGEPILVAVDTVAKADPQLRAGRTLFFRAASAKGSLATTGNDWMSCAGCHLDGFTSTNLRLFQALAPPPNPALEARIAHVNLADNFSTAVQVGKSGFSPHDLVEALLEQGGLAPDRTGASRTGAVDPAHPPAAAVQMAEALARVLALDLPQQPTWLTNDGPAPDALYASQDGAWCGQSGCHATEYAEWSQSVHAHSGVDPMFLFGVRVQQDVSGPQYSRLCAGCHDPVGTRMGDASLTSGRGVTCLGCHDVTRLQQAGGNADLVATTNDWMSDHRAWGLASLDLLKRPEFCGACHSQFVPGDGLLALTTFEEYQASPFAPATRCVDCHMAREGTTGSTHNHRFPGGNTYMGQRIGDATLLQQQAANLAGAVQISARQVDGGAMVTLHNGGAAHDFPTGVTDIREPWVELQPRDAQGNVLAHLGGPASATDPLPPGAARLGVDLAAADGTVLLFHQIGITTRLPYAELVPSRGALSFFVPVTSLPAGTKTVDAVLLYRHVRASYYRAAAQDPTGGAPVTEMARAVAWTVP